MILKSEIEKHHLEVKDKESELEYWKQKFNQIENAYKQRINEMQEMQSNFETTKRSHVVRQLIKKN